MNSKHSMWKLFVGVAGLGLLVNNCTIKSTTDDGTAGGVSSAGAGNTTSGECSPVGKKVSGCICAGNLVSYQLCTSEGIYGECVCTTGSQGGASSGGASSAGASNGGASYVAGSGGATADGGASPAAAGEGGEGGAGPTVFATCEDCLDARCSKQYAACDADPNCISANIDGSGQYERIAECINKERVKGLVKRDVVRGCGVTIGVSSNPDVISNWAPEDMDPVTTDLLNCMADAPGAAAASWANDDANYPVDGNDMINPTPWPAGTCAKDACTSAL